MKVDRERALIGGVCAGLANHFNLDPLFLRLAFFLAFWFFGVGIFVYILLFLLMQ